MQQKSLALSQGAISYSDQGEGPTLLFVHGLLVDGRLWNRVTPHLAGAHRCIVPDWPLGSHRTPLLAGADRSPRGIAQLIADFMEQLKLEQVIVVANDTGGAISQILAAERPERLRGLVLTNCDCLQNFLPPLLRPLQWLAYMPGAYAMVAQTARSARVRRSGLGYGMLSHEPLPDELTGEWLAPVREPALRADLAATLKAIDKRDTLAAAERLSQRPLPMLLAWGQDDPFFKPRFARELASRIPGTRLEQIPSSRTFVPWDQPESLAGLIAGFAQESPAGITTPTPAA